MKSRLLCVAALGTMIPMNLTAQVTPIPDAEFIPMVAQQTLIPYNTSPDPILAQTKSLNLNAGDILRVFGRVEFTDQTNGVDASAYTECVGPNEANTSSLGEALGYAEQNYEGSTHTGPSYTIPGHLIFYPLLLFQAPTAGAYVCQLRAHNDTPNSQDMVVVGRSLKGDNTTWLRVSAASDVGAFWWQGPSCDEWGNTDGNAGPSRTPPGPSNPNYSASWCNYLGGAKNPKQLYVFYNDNSYSTPPLWRAPGDAAFVDASASLMITLCGDTSSCTKANSSGDRTSVVNTHMELIQLRPTGTECIVTQSPDQTTKIGAAPHHYMIYHKLLTVPVYPSCGAWPLPSVPGRNQGAGLAYGFRLRIYVQFVSGSPVKIDGYTPTHAFAIKSASGTAPPVPDVAAMAENAAGQALAAAGYAVPIVSYEVSTAPNGTILSQYPSAGTIEFPGSDVDLTVAGTATVPDLVGSKESEAESAIAAAGLVLYPNPPKELPSCTNIGLVASQNPLKETRVVRNSTVEIFIGVRGKDC
jgi:hypothetical protein